MINIDTRFLTKVNESEMWLLLHITKRLGKKMYCFPSNSTLMKDTGWRIDKLRVIKKQLEEKGILYIEPGNGKSNNYHVKTDEIGVFIGADRLSETPSEKPTGGGGENQQGTPSEKPTSKYYPLEVLTSNVSVASDKKQFLEVKRKELYDKLRAFVGTGDGKYTPEIVREFYEYWTEGNEKELRYMGQKYFDLQKRLAYWKRRDDEKKSFKFEKKGETAIVARNPGNYNPA